ncbi:MAG: hypothetical protein QXX30_00635 [Candidatus Aenigmatarchaeota archaeon]
MLAPFEFARAEITFEYLKTLENEEDDFSFKKVLKANAAKDFYKHLRKFISKYYKQVRNSEGDSVQDVLNMSYVLNTHLKVNIPRLANLGVKNISVMSYKAILKLIKENIDHIYREALRYEKEIVEIIIFIEFQYLTKKLDKVSLKAEVALERKEIF